MSEVLGFEDTEGLDDGNAIGEMKGAPSGDKVRAPRPPRARNPFNPLKPAPNTQEFYDKIEDRFNHERDIRLAYRPEGRDQFIYDVGEELEKDPHAPEWTVREPYADHMEAICIGGGFSGLLAAARMRERGLTNIRIIDRGADVGGTWYWNRYPGIACDTPSYDYIPLLDELKYVPKSYFAQGPEIWEHCRKIAREYNLYEMAVFQTTVTKTHWDEGKKVWHVETDRGDKMTADYVVVANGTLSKPKLSRIAGMDKFQGHSFHTSRFDYEYTGQDLSGLKDKVVGIIGTGATAVQIISRVAAACKHLYVFQRTPSAIDIRDDGPTDPEWAADLKPGWQRERRMEHMKGAFITEEEKVEISKLPRDEKIRRQKNLNIEHMLRIHRRIEEVVEDPETAEVLKPWYMHRCKRPTFDDVFLPTFNRDNVTLVHTDGKGITEINEKGPVYDGTEFELDTLIYATGFAVQRTGIYNDIRGIGGLELNEKYKNGMRTVFGVHSQGYPNLFIMGGYQANFQFNLTFMLQTQAEYIADVVQYTRENGHKSIDPTDNTEQWWVDEVVKNRARTDRNKQCTPGYYNFEGEAQRNQDGNYNGSFEQYYQHMQTLKQGMTQFFNFG